IAHLRRIIKHQSAHITHKQANIDALHDEKSEALRTGELQPDRSHTRLVHELAPDGTAIIPKISDDPTRMVRDTSHERTRVVSPLEHTHILRKPGEPLEPTRYMSEEELAEDEYIDVDPETIPLKPLRPLDAVIAQIREESLSPMQRGMKRFIRWVKGE